MTGGRVLFIGLGAMGLPMARRLCASDEFEVAMFDIDPAAVAVARQFGPVAESLPAAVGAADVICTMLPADDHVRSVASTVARHAHGGEIFVDFSTTSVDVVTDVEAALAASGVKSVSASCMKGVSAARDGTLTLFIGGDETVVAQLSGLFNLLASDAQYVGAAAAAKGLKLINNYVVACTNLAVAEALVAAAVLGYPPEAALLNLNDAGLSGWAMRNHVAKHMVLDDVSPGIFSVDYMTKDVSLAAGLARTSGEPLFFAANVLAALRGTGAMGYSDYYHPIVVHWVARGACIDSITDVPPSRRRASQPDGADHLWEATELAVRLATVAGVRVGPSMGLSERETANWLGRGSAQNRTLDSLQSIGDVGLPPPGSREFSSLLECRQLGQSVRVPLAMIETAWHAGVSEQRRAQAKAG